MRFGFAALIVFQSQRCQKRARQMAAVSLHERRIQSQQCEQVVHGVR